MIDLPPLLRTDEFATALLISAYATELMHSMATLRAKVRVALEELPSSDPRRHNAEVLEQLAVLADQLAREFVDGMCSRRVGLIGCNGGGVC